MLEVMGLAAYVIVVIAVGIKLYVKTDGWMTKIDRVTPFVKTSTVVKYGFLAFILALFLEGVLLFVFRSESTTVMMIALVMGVGFIEEGAKLLSYFSSKGSDMYRWHLTVKVALAFAVVEAILYGLALFFSGNILGALLRIIVVMFHVAFTTIALGDVMRGDPLLGYLKASVLHSLYDAPVLLAIVGAPVLIVVLISTVALIYTYSSVDDAFGRAYSRAQHELEKRKREAQEFWREKGVGTAGSDLTSLP
ncbi:PrsW family glutamic-type intramembrane protease [Thermococcus sp.]|uniref:PrsW family glutamic-type intramembrane protease n=1 Tax=Thermococcus sp. TaxID=35749 RepID=UPI002616C76C|nr:PrsW family glutamic-type intramembrane protease [Thermococcus sp.]